MGLIKSYYHDEICALKESDDSFSRDYKAEEAEELEWEQKMYREKEALKWVEGVVRDNLDYQKGNEDDITIHVIDAE